MDKKKTAVLAGLCAALVLGPACARRQAPARRPLHHGAAQGAPLAPAGVPGALPWPAREIAERIGDLSSPEWQVREPSIRKICDAGSWIAPFLMVAMKNPDPRNRVEVAYCLGRIGDPIAVPCLVEVLLEDPPFDQLVYIADALGAIGDRSAAEALSPLVRYTVEREVYGRDVGPVELKAMESREVTVRQAAAEALARLGDTSHFPLLIEGLAGNGWLRRDAAVRLSHLTGGKVDFGFYLDMPKAELDKAIASWHSWWESNKASFVPAKKATREALDVYQPREKK